MAKSIVYRRRPIARGQSVFITRADFEHAAELSYLLSQVLLTDEGRWEEVALRRARVKRRAGFDPSFAKRAGKVLGVGMPSGQADELHLASTAARIEHHMQILKERCPGGWACPIDMQNTSAVDAALQRGGGIVLWVAHFAFNSLATKKAFSARGLNVHHLSRPEHGFSKSRFGKAVLNPIRAGIEDRYLASRLMIRGNPAGTMLAAHRLLAKNAIVSITAGDWEGSSLASVPFGEAWLPLATGAPALAFSSGAALLPVFTVRAGQGRRDLSVVIGDQIQFADGCTRAEAVDLALADYGRQTLEWVRRFPGQWRGWSSVSLERPEDF